MKIAISIPDVLFEAADRMAKRLGLSRSELYQRAVERFIRDFTQERVTDDLNRVYRQSDSGLDEVLQTMQDISLPKEDW